MKRPTFVSATVSASELLAELRFVQRASAKRSTMPVLRNVLMDLAPAGLSLAASDLDLVARTRCRVKANGSAKVTAPIDLLIASLGNLVGENGVAEVTLRIIDDDTYSVEIEGGGVVTRVYGISANDFVTLPAFPAELPGTLSSDDFHAAIKRVRFAITQEETRFQLNGALMKIDGGSVELVATDGHRMAVTAFPAANRNDRPSMDGEYMLHRSTLDVLLSLDGLISFGKHDNYLHFRDGNRCVSSRNIDVNFPDYRAVIAGDLDRKAIIDAEAMALVLRRVMPFTYERTRAIKLNFSADTLRIDADNPETGKASASIAIDYHGPDMFIGLCATYVLDFVAPLTGNVEMCLKDEDTQVILRPVGSGSEYLYIVMPMRLGR